ncbi:MAG: hypothetical protein ACHP7N_15850 [Caulobacterales bacterium]
MSTPETDSQRAVSRFWGGLLIAVGGLIAGLCGSCTVYFLSVAMSGGPANWPSKSSTPSLEAMLSTSPIATAIGALVIGGLPTALGVLLFVSGWRDIRRLGLAQSQKSGGQS